MAYVYRHIRLDKNEVFYIGVGKSKYRSTSKSSRNKYWKNIVNKTNYDVEILLDDLSWEEACEKEKEFIQLYGRKDLGKGTLVNMTDGGEGIKNVSDESRKVMSKKHSGKKLSEKHKKNIGLGSKGKILSNEHKLAIVRKLTGHTLSSETKFKISNKLKGGKKSKDAIQKMSNSLKGKIPHNKGKKFNYQTKKYE